MASTETTAPEILSPEELERYADAIVHGSLHLQAGETLFVAGQPGHRELMVALAAAGYRAGASVVDVAYQDPRVTAARVRHAADEHLGPISPWREREIRAQLAPDAAIVTVLGESDPGVFDGLPPQRLAEDTNRALGKVKWYVRAVKEGRRNWAGVAWPTPHWASQVYPDLDEPAALRRLAQDILWFCRLGPDDPPGWEGWSTHVETIARRAETLTELGLERLELRGPGTSLDLTLVAETRWLGGEETNLHGRRMSANMPTEENFTSPDPRGTEGTFRCSRPLSYRGRTIEGIAGEFRGGRLVRLEAATDEDRDFLAAFIGTDKGSERLGEVALVDSGSRIGQADRVYWNTLIDENAVAHIAFGSGFGQTRAPGAKGASRVNASNLHLDVMIGTDDLEVTGVRRGGDRVALIADGAWQI